MKSWINYNHIYIYIIQEKLGSELTSGCKNIYIPPPSILITPPTIHFIRSILASPPSPMAAFNMLKLSFLLSLLSNSQLGHWSSSTTKSSGISPPTCSRIECPSYDVIHVGDGYEVRRFNSTVWVSTSPIQDISLVEATRTGFLQ